MKTVNITYHCDYCKQKIAEGEVEALCKGHIGYEDAFIPDSDKVLHYHDYCLEHLLTLEFRASKEEKKESVKAESKELAKKATFDPHAGSYYGPFKPGAKDLDGLKALLDQGWKQKDIANEFQVSETTITRWKQELENGK